MNVLDIFYNEIVNEASAGIIHSYFTYYILFDTNIEGKLINSNNEYNDVIVPVLNIKNKDMFDTLLVEYVAKALDFYADSKYITNFLEDAKLYNEEVCLEKIMLAVLWNNATIDDFQDPISFLKRRIAFLDSEIHENIINYGNVPLLNGKLSIEIKKTEIYDETPYKMIISLINEVEEIYNFPEIKFGLENDNVYFYAIQNEKNDRNNYSKKINRILYKVGEGFNEEEAEIFGLGNLKDISASFLVALNITVSYFYNLGYNNIIASNILLTRWNAKRIVYEKKLQKNLVDNDAYLELLYKQEKIQENLTEKFLRTFLRLKQHYNGINIISYPFDVDSNLHMNLSGDLICNNKLLKCTKEIVELDIKNRVI